MWWLLSQLYFDISVAAAYLPSDVWLFSSVSFNFSQLYSAAIHHLMFEARGGPLANRHPPIILLPLLRLQLNHPSVCLSAALFVHHMLSISFHPFDFSFLSENP